MRALYAQKGNTKREGTICPKKEILKDGGTACLKHEILKDEIACPKKNVERYGHCTPKTKSLIGGCPKNKINFINEDLR